MTELGNKHECLSCSTKFYDLGKSKLICPNCGADQKELAEAGEGSTTKEKRKPKAKKKAKTAKKKKKKVEPEEAVDTDKDTTPDTKDKKK